MVNSLGLDILDSIVRVSLGGRVDLGNDDSGVLPVRDAKKALGALNVAHGSYDGVVGLRDVVIQHATTNSLVY